MQGPIFFLITECGAAIFPDVQLGISQVNLVHQDSQSKAD